MEQVTRVATDQPSPRDYATTLASALLLIVMFQTAGRFAGGYSGGMAWLAVGLFAFLSVCVVIYFDYWRYWLVRPLPARNPLLLFVELFACLGMLTTFVAYLLGAMYQEGVAQIEGAVDAAGAFEAATAACLWHFLDAVPGLDAPKTLNWTLTHPFTDKDAGAVLLVYKVLVILPVLAVATELVGRARGTRPSATG